MQDYPVFQPEKYSAFTSSTYHPSNSYHSQSSVRYTSPPQTKSHYSQYPTAPFSVQQRLTDYVNKKETLKTSTIKGQSRIEYIPIEKKVIDYKDQPRYELVPKKRKMTDYVDQVKVDIVPRQVVETDYYAVENIRCYIPQVIEEKKMQYLPRQRKQIKYEYIPVERQIVHYPEHSHDDEVPRYLGVSRTTAKKYENLRESDVRFWQRQYGYRRGQPIEALNRRIRQKYENDKQLFFSRIKGEGERQRQMKERATRYSPNKRY